VRIGIDLGGTKIELVALSSTGEIVFQQRIDTPKDDYDAVIDTISQLVDTASDCLNFSSQQPLGIGTPGAISLKTGLMMNCNSTCLNGRALQQDLAKRTARQVRIANDADCFTLSEASDGHATSESVVFGVILGTGVGGGIVVNKNLLQGVNAISGEWGHNALSSDRLEGFKLNRGRACFCGKSDCVETWLAGPSFQGSFQQLLQERNQLSDPTLQQTATSPIEIVAAARSGNEFALECLEQYCNLLALALSNVINILDPGVVVFGGGMSNVDEIYERVPDYLSRYIFADTVNTRFVKARYGDSSGVRGAAWLWPDHQ
jgi:fructokinase